MLPSLRVKFELHLLPLLALSTHLVHGVFDMSRQFSFLSLVCYDLLVRLFEVLLGLRQFLQGNVRWISAMHP